MLTLKSSDTMLSRMVPFGIDHGTSAHPLRDLLGAIWENRHNLSYAWNILTRGVCDGCSLGSYGLRDNVLGGLHLCAKRLKGLRFNTMAALDPSVLSDPGRLQAFTPEKVRSLGRLAHPMIRRKYDRGFARITWPEAFEFICHLIHDTPAHELGFCAAPCGITNEVYYVFQKLARTLGTNNISLSSPSWHASGVAGLKATLGVGAPTCSLSDCIDTDLLVIANPDPTDAPFAIGKYVAYARKRGTRIVLMTSVSGGAPAAHTLPWFSRALNGADYIAFEFRAGGEIAFINGVLKMLIEWNRIDHEFISRHTRGLNALAAALAEQPWELIERVAGAPRQEMERFAALYGSVSRAVFVYDTGLTRCESGSDNVKAIVNLALIRGMLGRENCGIMPIRAHSGLQGGEECGIASDQFPGGLSVDNDNARRFSNLWRHPVSSAPGLNLTEMLEAARERRLKGFYLLGADPFETFSDRHRVADALSRVNVRVHQNTALDPSMLVDGSEAVLILPAKTRYEQKGGGIVTTNERKVCFTPEIPGHSIGESLPAWEILTTIARGSMPNGDLLFPFNDAQSIRQEMARVIPFYQQIDKLIREVDFFQWGGPQLFKGGIFRGMPGERALFSTLKPHDYLGIDLVRQSVTDFSLPVAESKTS